jgi:hypothetical protein
MELAKEQELQSNTSAAPTQRASPDPYASNDDILTLNDQERGITPQDSDDVKWNYINGACIKHLVLTGVVSGVEQLDTRDPLCVVDYEGIRIVIPSSQMFMDEWPEGEHIPQEYRMRLGRMLGATIDFMPVGVDIRNRVAVASRRAAMQNRITKYYKTGRVKAGIRIACRVIGIGNNYLSVEAVGVDTDIEAIALSWEWFADATSVYATGDLVVAKVLAVTKDEETGHYSVRLSVKAATENPDLPALRKLVPGCNYYGVVTGVRDRLIFVRLQAGVNAKTKLYYTKQIPSKFDTVSFQVRAVDEDTGVAFGLITRIVRRHARLR